MKYQPWKKTLALLAALSLLLLPRARAQTEVCAANARSGPEWLRAGTIYEVFPRDFSSAGNLNGITVRLDELHDLGVNVLWLMPIHPIGVKGRKGEFGSPYSIRDYYAISPDYGTLEDFKTLVAEAHRRDMKVIMDVVANHTAWDSVMMKQPEFYKQDAPGHIIPPVPEWTDVAGLNYSNPGLRKYMTEMLKYWLKEADVDGFRCDVAYMVPTDFWEQSRAELMKVKTNIMLLAEASKPELLTNAFDIDYSWPLLSTMNNVIQRGAPASDLRKSWEESRRQFPQHALHMRITDNHDEARAVARYGMGGALAGSALMFTLDGVPLLYNGMEVGDTTESGDPALFEKLPIFWRPKDRPPLRDIYRDLIQMRKRYPALRNDRVDWLRNSDESRLVSFLRADEANELLVVINFSNRPLTGQVELKECGGFAPVKISGLPDPDARPLPAVNLNGFEWRIYRRSLK